MGETKNYTCIGKHSVLLGTLHDKSFLGARYWESDRLKTTFHIPCLDNGLYNFDGMWPNCTEGLYLYHCHFSFVYDIKSQI